MIAFVRKNLSSLILKHTSPTVCRSRSPVPFSLSLSTLTKIHDGISPTLFDILVCKYKFHPELASRVVSEVKNTENADSMLSFFKESGFSNTQLKKILKYQPRFLSASLEGTIKPKIKILQDEGLSSDDIAMIIAKSPRFLHLSVENTIIPTLYVLKGFFESTNEVARIISQPFLSADFENTVVPNVEFLKSCGIPMERIRIILTCYPQCFSLKPEAFRKCAEKAKEMGLNASSKGFIYAIATIGKMSSEAWELKLQAFRNLGFSNNDISTMFGKAPATFWVSTEKLNKVVGLLLGTEKYSIACIVNFPSSLWYSVDKRYIPRLNSLGILERRKLLKKWPSLGELCRLTDEKFSGRFIGPYRDEVKAKRR